MSEPPASVETQLAVINTKLDTLLVQRNDHESRLRALERFKWLLLGVAAASGPVWQAFSSRAS